MKLGEDPDRALSLRSFELRIAGIMATRAGYRGWFIKKHHRAIYRLAQLVAVGASDLFVRALQRERCLLMIEERRLPLVAVVAGRAVAGARSELIGVRILVAFRARSRSGGEIHMDHGQFQLGRLVAIDAGNSAVSAIKRKSRTLVIEF